MSARRQRQADAEQRRKELVEQLERDRDRVKKAGDQVREFGEACKSLFPAKGPETCGPLHPVGNELEKRYLDGESMSGEEFSAYLAALKWTPSTIIPQSVPTIELTGEASAEATEILNEAAEDEMVEKLVDEIVEESERAELLGQVPGSSEVLKDVPWSELNEAIPEVSPDTDPVPDSPLTAERQDDLGDEQRTDEEVPGDVDKATPNGDGWE